MTEKRRGRPAKPKALLTVEQTTSYCGDTSVVESPNDEGGIETTEESKSDEALGQLNSEAPNEPKAFDSEQIIHNEEIINAETNQKIIDYVEEQEEDLEKKCTVIGSSRHRGVYQ